MFELFHLLAESLKAPVEILYVAALCLALLFMTALYVLHGLALTTLCRASRKGSVWMAWVPFANLYLPGLLADAYTDHLVLRGDVDAGYAPSTLRRKMLGFSIAEAATGAVVGAAWVTMLATSILGFVTALFGGFLGSSDAIDAAEGILGILAVSTLITFVGGAVFLFLHIKYLVSACKAYHRLLRMLDTPVAAMWSVFLIFFPLLPAFPLFVMTMRRRGELVERFFPPLPKPVAEADDTEPVASQADPT